MTLDTRPARAHKPRRIHYPERDGKPVGETDVHIANTFLTLGLLRFHFGEKPNVYVAANNFIYFEEGNPRARVSPDGYVVFGAPVGFRRSYYVWKEAGLTPSIVFEFTSRTTQHEDQISKRELYEKRLRVPEYILFDPEGEYLAPRFQGLRLTNGLYAPIAADNERLYSETLDLELFVEGQMLRYFDPKTGRNVPTPTELAAQAAQAIRGIQDESDRAEDATRRAEENRGEPKLQKQKLRG